jgi:isoquinoline 1-oxidoreductase subunit beta
VPRMNQVPQMHVEVIQTDNHPTGVGQMATPLVAPAIANAVAELAGVRLCETPMTRSVRKAGGKVMASQFGFEEQGNERD